MLSLTLLVLIIFAGDSLGFEKVIVFSNIIHIAIDRKVCIIIKTNADMKNPIKPLDES